MLSAAAQAIFEAHQNGLVTVLWIYPRGKAVGNEKIHISLLEQQELPHVWVLIL
jgi:DhnA-type fructose-1,6-bisphosphate aldolase and related enzymes